MANWTWTTPGETGDWTSPDWTGDGTQGAGQTYPSELPDSATIGDGTSGAISYQVNVGPTDSITVGSVTLNDSDGTLDVQSGGSLSASNLTVGSGLLDLATGGQLDAGLFTLDGAGSLVVDSDAILAFTTLDVNGGTATDATALSNSGAIIVSINGSNFGSFTNSDNGSLSNSATGQIAINGGGLFDNLGSLTNEGVLTVNDDGNLTNSAGGTLVNDTTLSIVGAFFGSSLFGGALYNYGDLVNVPGALLNNNGIVNAEADTIANGGTIENSGFVTIAGGATIDGDGAFLQIGGTTWLDGMLAQSVLSIQNGSFVLDGGSAQASEANVAFGAVLSGYGTTTGPLINNGVVEAVGGSLTIAGAMSGTGSATIGVGATLSLGGFSSEPVAFSGAAVLQLSSPSTFSGVMDSIVTGDIIDLSGVATAGLSASVQGSSLVVSRNGTPVYTFTLASTYPGEFFLVSSDGSNGTDLTAATEPDDQWVGRSADWSVPSDWSLGVPTSTTVALINPVSPVTVAINEKPATAGALTVDAGNTIDVDGSLNVAGTLEIQAADGLEITGGPRGAAEISARALNIDSGSFVDHVADNVIISAETFTNDGTYAFSGADHVASITISADMLGTGTLAFGGLPNRSGVGVPKNVPVTLDLTGGVATTLSFLSNNAVLRLDDPSGFSGQLQGLTIGDLIELPGVSPTGTTASLQGTNLVIDENGMPSFSFALSSTFSGEDFKVSSLSGGGSEIAVLVGKPIGSDDQWVGRSASWSEPSDWSLGVPTSTTVALINPVSPVTVAINGKSAAAAAMTVDAGNTINVAGSLNVVGTLEVQAANGLEITGGPRGPAEISASALNIDGGSFVDHVTGDVIISGETFTNDGTYAFSGTDHPASITISADMLGTGTLAFGGRSNISATGAGAPKNVPVTLELTGGVATTLSFVSNNAVLRLDDPSGFSGLLQELTVGDLVELPGVSPIGTTASLQGTSLVIDENGTPAFSFALSSTFSGEDFKVSSLSGAGSEISVLKG